MIEHFKSVAQILLVGALIVVGMRAAEWVIPQPEMRVVMCFANEIDQVEVCNSLKELLDKAGLRKKVAAGEIK